MEEHPLLRTLESWPGRGPTQLALEALGFWTHRAWQNRIIQFCGEQQAYLLDRYWDEVALETMQSLGKGNPDKRWFSIEPKYHSAFLDDLFASRDFVEPAFPSPRLIKCMFERFKKMWFDAEFRQGEVDFFSAVRKAESERLNVQTKGWSGRKRDVIPFVGEFCRAAAFQPHRNRWRKKSDSGLIFEVGVDLGGNPYCITPPLKFRIFHADDPKYAFDMDGGAVLDRLVPGVAVHEGCADPSEYVLGIRTFIALFDVIATSLGTSQQA